jgi:hypothetical protein
VRPDKAAIGLRGRSRHRRRDRVRLALASLVEPDLSRAPFTDSGTEVPIRAKPAALALAAAGLLFVAVATLAGQAIVTSRRGVARRRGSGSRGRGGPMAIPAGRGAVFTPHRRT